MSHVKKKRRLSHATFVVEQANNRHFGLWGAGELRS
jgi:hypothetical protein